MADDVQGLSAEISGDATPLLRALERAEAALRSFDQRWGKTTIQIAANVQQQGGQAAAGGISHELIAALRAPAGAPGGQGGRFVSPAQAASLTPQLDSALRTHDAQLANEVNAASTVARSNVREAVAASGVIQQPAVVVPTAAEPFNETFARAEAQARANSTGRAVQYQTPGGIQRVFPTGGGPVGGRGESVGGVTLPPGAATFTGGNPRAEEEAAAFRREAEELRAKLAAQTAARSAAGRAGAAAAGRDPVTGRFVSTQAEAQIQRPVFDPTPFVAEIQQNARALAELRAAANLRQTTPEVLESLGPQGLQRNISQLRQGLGEDFEKLVQVEFAKLQPQGTAATGRQIILPDVRQRITTSSPELTAAQTAVEASQQAGFVAQQVRPSSPRVATARFVGGLLGIPDVQELERVRQQQTTRLQQFQDIAVGATQQREKAEADLQDRQSKGLEITGKQIDQLEAFRSKEAQATKAVEEQTTVVQAASKAVEEAGGPLRGFAASFAGGVAGGLAFGAAIQVVGGAIGLVDKAISPVVERLTGYQNIAAKLTDTLSDQTRQAKGQVDIVLAQAAAQSNLNDVTAAAIQPALASRTATEAGNKAISDQVDLVNSAIAIQQQQAQFAAQNPALAGFNQNLFQTTGGLNILGLQTPLFGTPSTQELVGRTLQAAIPLSTGQAQSANQQITGLEAGGGGVGTLLGFLGGGRQDQKRTTLDLTKLQENVDFFNAQMEKGGEQTVRYQVNIGNAADKSKALADAQATLLQGIAPDVANALKLGQGRLTITGLSGSQLQQQVQFAQAQQAFNLGAQTPSPQQSLAQERQQIIPAALFQAAAQAQLQGQVSTAQIGIQAAQNPLIPFGTSIPGGIGAVSPGLRGLIGNTQNFDNIQVRQIQAAEVQIQQIAGANGLLPQNAAQAGADFNAIRAGGAQIAGIQAGITQEQVGLQTAQFDEQIRQQKLALTDLAQITGRIGATAGDNLGIYERQSIVLGRQSAELQLQSQQLQLQNQALQIQVAQRQINFQVAVAAFAGGPGATPEERYARQQEAKQEAELAQKQLDIQKQQQAIGVKQLGIAGQVLPISFRIEDIQHNRDYITAQHALDLLTRGRQVAIDTAAASEAIAHIQAGMQAAEADLQKLLQEGQSVISTLIGEASKYIATYKTSTQTLEQSAADFFNGIGTSFATSLDKYVRGAAASVSAAAASLSGGGLLSGTGPGYGGNTAATGPHQTGYIGSVSSATHMTVGEAGTETVAILRNPRDMVMGSGGGGASVTIHFNGPITVGSKEDIDALATLLTRKVEESLSRKTSLLGFRSPS